MLLNGIYEETPEKILAEDFAHEVRVVAKQVLEEVDQFALFDNMLTDAEVFLRQTVPLKLEENPRF